jgi:hypothetical protein
VKELATLLNEMLQAGVMLRRQTEWQNSRRSLTWPEKIRMAERIRESIRTLRAQPRPARPESPKK